MSDPGWLLIVEPGEEWTAAIGAELRRSAGDRPRLRRQTRPPTPSQIATHAALFVAIGLQPDDVLTGLGQLREFRRLSSVGVAALISPEKVADPATRRELALAALEAGACLAVDSPRRLGPLLTIARRSIAAASAAADARLAATERVWRRLPWQAEPWPVG